MAWRSVVITKPARLSFKYESLVVRQNKDKITVPLEDISVLVIDNPQVLLTSRLLSSLAENHISLLTVDASHLPNGIFLPFLPHSRALKVMRLQLNMTVPAKKRLWQSIVKQKLNNQAHLITRHGNNEAAREISILANGVRSGDPDNYESQAARRYFPVLFGKEFRRSQDRFYNNAINYSYSVLRSSIARSLVSYGFLPAFGLHHRSEQNAFNLADDLIEPFRPVIDSWVVNHYPIEPVRELLPEDKGMLVRILHEDIPRIDNGHVSGKSTVLTMVESIVISLSQRLTEPQVKLIMPGLPSYE